MDWLREWSVDVVREVLGLDGPIVLRGGPHPDPQWAGGGAVIDGRVVATRALSAATAERIVREAGALEELIDLPVPRLVRWSCAPAFLVTRLVAGAPLGENADRAGGLRAFLG